MNRIDKEAPDSGELIFLVDREPVSLQSKSDKKKLFKTFIKNIISPAEFYLSGDVRITIDWYVHEQKRYETDSAYDVDNIIKPFIDSISGVSGIIIDDNQVQSINCSWLDCYDNNEKLEIKIYFNPCEQVRKSSIYFVEFNNSLCLPVWEDDPPLIQREFIITYEKLLKYRDELNSKVKSYYTSKAILPVQRLFHKTRLSGLK